MVRRFRPWLDMRCAKHRRDAPARYSTEAVPPSFKIGAKFTLASACINQRFPCGLRLYPFVASDLRKIVGDVALQFARRSNSLFSSKMFSNQVPRQYFSNSSGLSCGISRCPGNFSGSLYSLLIDAARFGQPDKYRCIPPMVIDETGISLHTKRVIAKLGII